MKKFKLILKRIRQVFWTPFNRDALWCVCIHEQYCTWNPKSARKNLTFCHVNDETQEHRERIGVALRIKSKPTSKSAILEIPYLVGISSCSNLHPIYVKTLEDIAGNAGDYFHGFGQYRFDGTETVDGRNYLSLAQINKNAVHVFKEPFIDWGQCDR